VRDLLIVGCWTGVRFSDISQITPDAIEDYIIYIKQSKTGGKVAIPVHDYVKAILDKYDGSLPPSISNQRFNEYLKEVVKKAKVKDIVHKAITKGGVTRSKSYSKWELVTTHTGRRSFATNNYLMGVPTLTIMAITGHKTESSFLKYIKVTPTEHAEKIRLIWKNQVTMIVS
jgi:integrase